MRRNLRAELRHLVRSEQPLTFDDEVDGAARATILNGYRATLEADDLDAFVAFVEQQAGLAEL